ncbi:MAG: hypothetical protein NZ602_01010, partial [Thermoguttaceae bacterium]|nr:hypothetical protein [Thermoguttaceae bacterium]
MRAGELLLADTGPVQLSPLPTAGEGALRSRAGEGDKSPLPSAGEGGPAQAGPGEGDPGVIPAQAGIQASLNSPLGASAQAAVQKSPLPTAGEGALRSRAGEGD